MIKACIEDKKNRLIGGQEFTENSVAEFNISLYFLIQFSCNQNVNG